LEVWSGFHKTTVTNRAILDAMLDRADQAGHDLSVHSLVRQVEVPISEEELSQRLRAQPGDGYLVSASLGPLFRRAFNAAFGSTQPSAVYVSPGGAQVDCEPMIRIDTDEAVMRGVRLLRNEGHRKVGMVAASNALRSGPTETSIYNWAAEAAGQVYRGVIEVARDTDGGYAGTLALLARDTIPDALYVANDELLPGVLEALRDRGRKPGHDIGLITLSTTARPLPPDCRWSQLQFDPVLVGHDAVDAILKLVQTAGRRAGSQSYLAKWIPGDTHRRV
jgi:DNA-binding LacI/PurR family transcriptional regulator